jgi:CheY-like chemotaxis protein
MKRVLLVLDDEPPIGRLFLRYLRNDFDEIHTCTTMAEAEEVLRRAKVTHLVVDNFLGRGQPHGSEAAESLRKKHPSIRYAALFTGSEITKRPGSKALDDVFLKPRGFDSLVQALRKVT